MDCLPRPDAGYPSLPPLQHRDPAFFFTCDSLCFALTAHLAVLAVFLLEQA